MCARSLRPILTALALEIRKRQKLALEKAAKIASGVVFGSIRESSKRDQPKE